MTIKSGNIYRNSRETEAEELVDQLLSKNNIKIERIVSKGHSSPASGWYDQSDNEWVIVLKGEAIICFEGCESYRMKEGDYLNIPAHSRHKVEWTNPDIETTWLAVHY